MTRGMKVVEDIELCLSNVNYVCQSSRIMFVKFRLFPWGR